MKRLLLMVGIVLLVAGVAFFGFFFGRSQVREATRKDTIKAEPAPVTQLKQPDGVVFSFSTAPVLPAALLVYEHRAMEQAEAENVADSAAKELGFNSTPSAVIRGQTYTKRWESSGGASLTLSVSGDNISFLYGQPRPQAGLKNQNPELMVRDAVSLFNKQSIGARVANTSSGPFDGIVMLDSPPALPLRGYFLEYVIDDYPVAVKEMNISAASIIVDANNVVRSAKVSPALSVTKSSGTISVLTPDQILTSLSERRGAVLDTNGVGSPELGSQPVFSSFRVNKTTLFYSPRGNLLLPALLLSGLGTTKTGESQAATFFLWAFPAGQ